MTSNSPDCIQLRALRVVCVVGVLPEERERAQPLELDVDVYFDLAAAGKSDDLRDTCDYGMLTESISNICVTEKAQLLERLAHVIAEEVLTLDGVSRVDITIKKIRPPIPLDVAYSAIKISRRR